jgi:nucleotide-binding universal stress UspA family protein
MCPVDFSDPSRSALRYASAIADHFGARLTVLTVNDPLLAHAAASAGISASFTEDTERELRRFCDEELAHTSQGPKSLEFRVAVGKPAEEILRHAQNDRVDLIVMGSRGRSGIRKMFFGSTTERVLRETSAPVLVTPDDRPQATSLSDIASHIGRIVAPVDLTPSSQRQVTVAAAIADALSVPLVITYVLEPVFIPDTVRSALSGADASRRAHVEESLGEIVTSIPSRVRTESLIMTGEPAQEIVTLAETRGANLIVMGLHSTGLLGPRMGSVTYRVLCLARALVLAIPPEMTAADTRVPASAERSLA